MKRDFAVLALIQKNGACRGKDTEIFFRAGEERPSKQRTEHEEAAIAVCKPCKVSGDCLDFALAHNEVGVWGGTTTEERRAIRRAGVRRGCPRCSGRRLTVMEDAQVCLSCGLSWLL